MASSTTLYEASNDAIQKVFKYRTYSINGTVRLLELFQFLGCTFIWGVTFVGESAAITDVTDVNHYLNCINACCTSEKSWENDL